MWRVAIYVREAPGRAGRGRLDRPVDQLAAQLARQRDWQHVATYADQWAGVPGDRPGLSRLLADAPSYLDMVVVDGYGRISPNRHELGAILGHLSSAGEARKSSAKGKGAGYLSRPDACRRSSVVAPLIARVRPCEAPFVRRRSRS
jgi:DNA invertase Pin-like site-specific DNA recombinase